MADNVTAAGTKQIAKLDSLILSDVEISGKLEDLMKHFSEFVDSPKVQLILRNAILTLLELPEHDASPNKMFLLLSDPQFREGVVNSLASETPAYWSEKWTAVWSKDKEPLYSENQQCITRRRSLVTFWTKEWADLPQEAIKHTMQMVERFTSF